MDESATGWSYLVSNKYTVLFKNSGGDQEIVHTYAADPSGAIESTELSYAAEWNCLVEDLDNHNYMVFNDHITLAL